jgi:hypothetical protein
MSYDLLILDDLGFPLYVFSLDIDTHHKVIDLAINKELSLISKISDYYEDSIYYENELDKLKKELLVIIDDTEVKDSDIIASLVNFINLVDKAILQKRAIEGIAD